VSGVNASNLPVFRLVLRMYCDDPEFAVAVERGTQGAGEIGRSNKLTNALETILDARGALDVDPGSVHIDIAFTDASGIRWLRTEDGQLQIVDESFNFSDVEERLIDRLIPMREAEQRARSSISDDRRQPPQSS
jgi:hypothetical protein